MVEAMDKMCGTNHGIMALSIFTGCSSLFLFFITVPTAFSVVYCLLSNESGKFKGMFYKLLLNIAVADLLKGLVADVASLNFHIREAIDPKKIALSDTYALHLSMFLSDAIALVTMTFFSIDRMLALLKPHRYRQGISSHGENLLIALTWFIGMLIVIPYFWLSFIKELVIFTTVNVSVATVALVTTAIVYRLKFKVLETGSDARRRKRANDFEDFNSSTSFNGRNENLQTWRSVEHAPSTEYLQNFTDQSHASRQDTMSCLSVATKMTNGGNTPTVSDESYRLNSASQSSIHGDSALVERVKPSGIWLQVPGRQGTKRSDLVILPEIHSKTDARKPKSRSHIQKRVTRTFMLMLLVFIVSYLPTCVMMIYMNVCASCNCTLIHVMRDLSALAILSSSTLRTLNFIFTLKQLRMAVKKMLRTQCDCRERLTL